MDFDLILRAASFAVSIGAGIYAWFATRQKDLREKFDGIVGRIDRQETRLRTLEQTVQAMPAKDDVHSLQLSLSGMGGEMREIRALLQGQVEVNRRLEAILTRHEDHLLGARR